MQWKFSGGRPVYVQIMEHIRGAILVGEFQPGGRIPPVRDFAAQAQVNPNTMQRALLELEREGEHCHLQHCHVEQPHASHGHHHHHHRPAHRG